MTVYWQKSTDGDWENMCITCVRGACNNFATGYVGKQPMKMGFIHFYIANVKYRRLDPFELYCTVTIEA